MLAAALKRPLAALRLVHIVSRWSHEYAKEGRMSQREHDLAGKIGKAAYSIDGMFCCGGALQIHDAISLWFTDKSSSESACMLKLPVHDASTMQKLVEAQTLCPNSFACSFDVGKTAILDDVLAVLGALSTDVRFHLEANGVPIPAGSGYRDKSGYCSAKPCLDHLIIYGFRAEVRMLDIRGPFGSSHNCELPPADDSLGSLVIGLPQPHSGGQLVVKHNGSNRVFDWSGTTTDNGSAIVQWAAFSSDCVLNVDSGYKIMLILDLHQVHKAGTGVSFPPLASHFPRKRSMPPIDEEDDVELARNRFLWKYMASAKELRYFPGGKNSTLDVETLPLYGLLCNAMGDAGFFPQGCTLGFGCEYHYVETSRLPVGDRDARNVLQGADAVIYAAATAAGLAPSLVRMFKSGKENTWDDFGLGLDDEPYGDDPPKLLARNNVVVGKGLDTRWLHQLGYSQYFSKDAVFEEPYSRENIVWCTREQDWVWRCCRSENCYSATAILLHIPPWGVHGRSQL